MQVIKRDGRKEQFDEKKIIKAISKCYIANEEVPDDKIINDVLTTIKSLNKDFTVEEIQDLIIDNLDDLDIAKAYRDYRDERTKVRDLQVNKHYYDTVLELVNGKQNSTSVENSNKDASELSVMRDLIAGETCKKLYKDTILSPYILKLHNEGKIHYHDLDYRLMKGITNCCLINLKDMLDNGTVMKGKFIRSPHSLRTASTIATQIITAVSSSQYGGISITLTHLAPYVRKSKQKIAKKLEKYGNMTQDMINDFLQEEIKDSMQTFLYQLNSMSSTNGQAPFITVFCYLNEDPEYKEETKMLVEELLKQRIEGMESPSGNNINPTFPKIIYVLDKDNIHEGDPDWDVTKLAAECTCKRMVPDYISAKVMKEYKEGNVFPSMGCRSFLHPWKDKKGNYKFYGRLNIGVISINLPYLALESKSLEEFKQNLNETIDLISSEQNKIYQTISRTSTDVAPILWKYGALSRQKDGSVIGDTLKNRYCSASIGYMGLAETIYRFGVEYPTKEGHDLGIKIMQWIDEAIQRNKEKYDLALSLYGTPAENTTDKFAKAIKKFPTIKHVNDRAYITNSYHIPVEYKIDGFSKIDFESEFQKYSLGGCISYVEMPDVRNNPEAILEVLKHIYEKMMYCEINTSSCSVCYKCGFEGQIDIAKDGSHCTCPNCGNTDPNKMHVVYRTCGYLGSFERGTSKGRAGDITNRVKHF